MTRCKQSIKLPNPANINPPTKSIRTFEKRISSELIRRGNFGAKKQVIKVDSIHYGYHGNTPSTWMQELLNNRWSIPYLRAQLNRDFAGSGWNVTWLEQNKNASTVKMAYNV